MSVPTPLEGETFRQFYERTRGPFPWAQGEFVHLAMERVADAVADWCDALRPRHPTEAEFSALKERARKFGEQEARDAFERRGDGGGGGGGKR